MADGHGSSPAGHRLLSLSEVDHIQDCTNRAKSIVTVLRYAAPELGDCPEDAVAGACFAVEKLMEEVEQIVAKEKAHG